MINRLLEQRRAIQRYLISHETKKIRNLDLDDSQWNLIADFESLLKPFDEVTKMFCQDVAPISLQFPLAKMIHSNLTAIEVSPELIAVKKNMISFLENKFFDLENNRLAFDYFYLHLKF